MRATAGAGVERVILKRNAEGITYLNYNGTKTNTIDFFREYRGFELQGFYVGEGEQEQELGKSFELTTELMNSITDENPLIAKIRFNGTKDVTLFYDDDPYSYRIPAIGTTSSGRIIAVSDYRHNLDDVGRDNHSTGTKQVDLVYRYSDDNGQTWSEKKTIVEGRQDYGYGDAAVAVVGEKILVMAVGGNVSFAGGNANNHNRIVYIVGESQEDGDITWAAPVDIADDLFIGAEAEIPNGHMAFFGSGKLAVDTKFIGTLERPRIYGALLVKLEGQTYNNFAVYSDDFGASWKILGGSTTPLANADEPKMEVLPNGQILLSVRRGGGRLFNVFTYGESDDDKANGVGTWNGNQNGCDNGGNSTNGEIFCIDAKKSDNTEVKLLLQSQPKGGSRANVTIWYKEVSANATYTSADIANGWTEGLQVSYQKSGYSAMTLQKDGKVAIFFEEAPWYADTESKGYCMVYAPLSIEQITKSNYFNPNIDFDAEGTINVVLTDAQGNEYRDQVQSTFAGIATALTGKYPFITLGDTPNLESDGETFTYTNSVTLPFKVSNEETTVWYNIYWPSNGNEASQRYPVYLSATAADDEFVPKVTESNAYGNSSYNTAGKADNISWAVYSVNGGFAFKFKNKLTGKFIQATSVATGDSKNVKYVDEASATAFVLDNVKQGDKCYGDYALKAEIGSTVGYLCSTSATNYHFATHYSGKGHAGAWARFAEAPDFEALFAEVNAVLNMFGDGLGQYSNVSAENLTAVNAAKEAMKNASSVKKSVLDSYKTYTSKTEGGTLNLPKNGQSFRVAYDYGGSVGKLYMQSTSSSVWGLQFTAETGEESIWLYYDGTLYSYSASKNLREHGNDRGLSDIKTTAEFSASTRAKGKYNIKCGSFIHANSNNSGKYYTDHCSSNNCAEHDLILEEIEPTTVTIGTFKHSTLYSAVALSIPEGVKAYTGTLTETEGETILTLNKLNGTIPANTGVVLYGEAGGYDFNITAKVNDVDNDLSGTATGILTSSVTGDVYTLQRHDFNTEDDVEFDGVAFKRYNGKTITAGKAYLVLDDARANALRISFADNEDNGKEDNEGEGTTGVEMTTDNSLQSTVIFDLQGRRVMNPGKGMYIVNGKKVIF